jgi:SAM-dependent methyltransferase
LKIKVLNAQAIVDIVNYLKSHHYSFTTVTPQSHRAVLEREFDSNTADLRDIFGWNRPFSQSAVNPTLFALMQCAGILIPQPQGFKSSLRFSSLDNHLYVHSGYPTSDQDAVFFGPDSYRYASLLKRTIAQLPQKKRKRVLDIGTGSGVGGIVLAQALNYQYDSLLLTDINPKALAFSRINVETTATLNAQFAISNLYQDIQGTFDLIVSNPPYLVDSGARAYRHGGGEYGSLLSTKIVLEGLPCLAHGGAMILYTASAIVNGHDLFLQSIEPIFSNVELNVTYEEIDPDVFGEELRSEAYNKADRIAVVSLLIEKS